MASGPLPTSSHHHMAVAAAHIGESLDDVLSGALSRHAGSLMPPQQPFAHGALFGA